LTGVASVKAAFVDTDYITVSYDGVSIKVSAGDITEVKGTLATNTAYVEYVKMYVDVTKYDGTGTKVLMKVPVNKSFTNVSSLD
jgi:hypothetical protein